MSEKIFFGKQKNDDRDCCVYIERPEFECGHFYTIPRPTGVCYSKDWDDKYEYNNLDTVLTEEEYDKFRLLIYKLNDVRTGLDKDEKKKKLADIKVEELNKFIDEYLLSEKAEKFKEKIKKNEIKFIKEKYNLDDEDIEDIYQHYCEFYFDRAIINGVFNSPEDVAEERIDNFYEIDEWVKNFIDYDKMGNDMVSDGDYYVELSDGRIVEYNY